MMQNMSWDALPCRACTLSHDSQQTISKADKLHFAQQSGPTCPIVSQRHYTDNDRHKKDRQRITQPVLHSSDNAQEWRENYKSDPGHLQQRGVQLNFTKQTFPEA